MELPKITERGATGFVLWLRRDQPAVWRQLVATIPEAANIESTIRREANLQGLGLFAEIGKSIANFAKNAMPKITAALPKIANAALEIGGQVVIAKQQAKLIDKQMAAAEAGQAPLPTQLAQGQVAIPDLATSTGVLTQPRVVAASIIPGVPNPVTYIGGGLLALILAKRLKLL